MRDLVSSQKDTLLKDQKETKQIQRQLNKQLKSLNLYKPHNVKFLSQLITSFSKT